jgi:precorrin-2 dehydrogenase/sirohydrochlorin ferrochelatase
MDAFPAFFPLKGARVVIAGADESAEAKARLFVGSPAEVVRLRGKKALDPAAYQGATLIFVASFETEFAEAAASAARTAGAPVNVVDRPEASDFHTPAIIDRGAVVAAIGTAGAAPLMASLMRAELELRLSPAAGPLAELLGARRAPLREAFPDLAQRRAFLRAILAGPVAEAAAAGDRLLAGRRLDAAIAGGWASLGRVAFIVPPEAEDLLSVRAVRLLNIADLVLADRQDEALLDRHARRDAERRDLCAAAAADLIDLARAGRIVAVLASPAPTLIEALRQAGVEAALLAPAPAA